MAATIPYQKRTCPLVPGHTVHVGMLVRVRPAVRP